MNLHALLIQTPLLKQCHGGIKVLNSQNACEEKIKLIKASSGVLQAGEKDTFHESITTLQLVLCANQGQKFYQLGSYARGKRLPTCRKVTCFPHLAWLWSTAQE